MLLKQALQEGDKRTLMDRLTPAAFNLTKMFEQADCNIKPARCSASPSRAGRVGAPCGW